MYFFSLAHAFFKSCPDDTNGRDCSTTKQLQQKVNGSVAFDTRLGYRDGGSCNIKQEVRYLALKKIEEGGNSEQVYFCPNFVAFYASFNCSSNSRFKVSYQGRDKFDFQLTLSDLSISDSGQYRLEVSLFDAERNGALLINRTFDLKVTLGE